MTACATRGWEYRILVRAGSYEAIDETQWTEGPVPRKFFPVTCGLREIQPLIQVPGTRGSRAMYPDQTLPGNRICGGSMRLKFGRQDLDFWLPYILGAAEAADVFKVANDLPWFQVLVDKGQGKYLEYRDCKIAAATFSGETGGVVNMDLDIVAKVEEEYNYSFDAAVLGAQAFTPSLSTRPLRFSEGFFSLGGTEVKFERFALSISNQIAPDFYAGSDAATCIDPDRRLVTLGVPGAHTSAASDLYKGGFAGVAGILRWQADNMQTRIDFPKLFWPKESTSMEGDGKTMIPLQMVAYRTEAGDAGADDEIKFTNDPVFTS